MTATVTSSVTAAGSVVPLDMLYSRRYTGPKTKVTSMRANITNIQLESKITETCKDKMKHVIIIHNLCTMFLVTLSLFQFALPPEIFTKIDCNWCNQSYSGALFVNKFCYFFFFEYGATPVFPEHLAATKLYYSI